MHVSKSRKKWIEGRKKGTLIGIRRNETPHNACIIFCNYMKITNKFKIISNHYIAYSSWTRCWWHNGASGAKEGWAVVFGCLLEDGGCSTPCCDGLLWGCYFNLLDFIFTLTFTGINNSRGCVKESKQVFNSLLKISITVLCEVQMESLTPFGMDWILNEKSIKCHELEFYKLKFYFFNILNRISEFQT